MRQALIPSAWLLFMCGGIASFGDEFWVQAEDYRRFHVVVQDAAAPSEHYAATEFQKYWSLSTGHEIPISDSPAAGKVNVWIGRAPHRTEKSKSFAKLGDEGFQIVTDGQNLFIEGGRKRGTLYGVYQFFDDYMGIRWLTPEFTHVPGAPPGLPPIAFRYTPPLKYRDVSYKAFVENPSFAAVHRLNGFWSGVPEEMGGHTGFVRDWNGFGHTFHHYVNPEEYFDEHPEYFSEVNGERLKYSQLCLTNEDVLGLTIAKVRQELRTGAHYADIVSISQMDWPNWCECQTCAALNRREGSPSGSLIHFVNHVAAAIADEFPGVYVDTLAYTYTRKPPKHLRPRDNVIVRLCALEGDFSRPMTDRSSPVNSAFRKDLKGWKRITKNLIVWDYTQNWYSHQAPHPNLGVLQPNIEYYAAAGAMGVYEQASPFSPHSDFEYLKGYILAKSLWQPETDWRRHYIEFTELYYGAAAPFVREYLEFIIKVFRAPGHVLGIANQGLWFGSSDIVASQAIFAAAFRAAENDDIRERLRYAFLPVQYSALVRYPEVRVTDGLFEFRRPPSQSFDEYWQMILGYGVTHLADTTIDAFYDRLGGRTPPRRETMRIERLDNPFFEIWIVPEFSGSIVRFRDKRTDQEYLPGYVLMYLHLGKWTERSHYDPATGGGFVPVSPMYRVVERAPRSLTVETELPNGLTIRRRMALAASSPVLDITLELKNRSEAPLPPEIQSSPEFSVGSLKTPQLWKEGASGWSRIQMQMNANRDVAVGEVNPGEITRWALRFPATGMTIVNTLEPSELELLHYVYLVGLELFSMNVIPDGSPIEPGETRVIHNRYEVRRGSLKKMRFRE